MTGACRGTGLERQRAQEPGIHETRYSPGIGKQCREIAQFQWRGGKFPMRTAFEECASKVRIRQFDSGKRLQLALVALEESWLRTLSQKGLQ